MSVLNADSFEGMGFNYETVIPADENNRFHNIAWPYVRQPRTGTLREASQHTGVG